LVAVIPLFGVGLPNRFWRFIRRGENRGLPGEKRTDGFYPGRILLVSFLVGRAFHEVIFPRSEEKKIVIWG